MRQVTPRIVASPHVLAARFSIFRFSIFVPAPGPRQRCKQVGAVGVARSCCGWAGRSPGDARNLLGSAPAGLHWNIPCIRPPSLKKSWCHESTESWFRMEDDRGSQSVSDAVGQQIFEGQDWCHRSAEYSFRMEGRVGFFSRRP